MFPAYISLPGQMAKYEKNFWYINIKPMVQNEHQGKILSYEKYTTLFNCSMLYRPAHVFGRLPGG